MTESDRQITHPTNGRPLRSVRQKGPPSCRGCDARSDTSAVCIFGQVHDKCKVDTILKYADTHVEPEPEQQAQKEDDSAATSSPEMKRRLPVVHPNGRQMQHVPTDASCRQCDAFNAKGDCDFEVDGRSAPCEPYHALKFETPAAAPEKQPRATVINPNGRRMYHVAIGPNVSCRQCAAYTVSDRRCDFYASDGGAPCEDYGVLKFETPKEQSKAPTAPTAPVEPKRRERHVLKCFYRVRVTLSDGECLAYDVDVRHNAILLMRSWRGIRHTNLSRVTRYRKEKST